MKALESTSTSISASKSAVMNKCKLSTSERVCTAIELKPREPAGIVILRTAFLTALTKSRPVVESKTGSTFSTLNNPFE